MTDRPRRRRRVPDEAAETSLTDALAAASAGLLYLSEGDAPLVPFALRLPVTHEQPGAPETNAGALPVDADTVRRLVGASPDASIEVETLQRFFAGHIEAADRADAESRVARPRFIALRALLAARTVAPRAYRVRDDAVAPGEVHCWAGGRSVDGRSFIGVSTTAYES